MHYSLLENKFNPVLDPLVKPNLNWPTNRKRKTELCHIRTGTKFCPPKHQSINQIIISETQISYNFISVPEKGRERETIFYEKFLA